MSDRPAIRRKFVDCADGQVHVRYRAGEGEPLVLLHASPGSAAMLGPLMSRLRTTRPLIAPDTLGNGDSEPPRADRPDIAYFARAVREVLGELGVERAAFYGTHTGAHLLTELAVTEPGLCSRVVIDGMGLYSRDDAEGFEDRYVPTVEPTLDGAQLWWVWHFVRDGYQFFPWFERDTAHRTSVSLPPAEVLHTKTVEVLKALGTYRHSYLAAFGYPKRERLGAVTVPALVTLGEQDVLYRYFDELVEAVPGARGVRIPAPDLDTHATLLAGLVDAWLDDRLDSHLASVPSLVAD